MAIKTTLGLSGYGTKHRGSFASKTIITTDRIGGQNASVLPLSRPILQSGTRSHSDGAGTWTQSGNVITISRIAHGVNVGEQYSFTPATGDGILGAGRIYDVASIPDANTLTLISATSNIGTGTITGTAKQAIYSGFVPGGSIGKNGSLKIYLRIGVSNSVNAKTFEVAFGGVAFVVLNAVFMATIGTMLLITNKNDERIQQKTSSIGSGLFLGGGAYNASDDTWTTSTIDTTLDQLVEIKVTKALGTEIAFLDSILVELVPSLD